MLFISSGRYAALAVVQQEADRHVLETRHHGLNRRCLYENGFRELQPIDLLGGNDHHLKPLEYGPLREGYEAWPSKKVSARPLCVILHIACNTKGVMT
jgi:hypothetical protein